MSLDRAPWADIAGRLSGVGMRRELSPDEDKLLDLSIAQMAIGVAQAVEFRARVELVREAA